MSFSKNIHLAHDYALNSGDAPNNQCLWYLSPFECSEVLSGNEVLVLPEGRSWSSQQCQEGHSGCSLSTLALMEFVCLHYQCTFSDVSHSIVMLKKIFTSNPATPSLTYTSFSLLCFSIRSASFLPSPTIAAQKCVNKRLGKLHGQKQQKWDERKRGVMRE